jgi:hypothetical protein
MIDHRIDLRTTKQFKSDLKVGHQKEAQIAVRLCISVHSKNKKWPVLKPTGIDMSGNYIEDISKVDCRPDFEIDGRMVEVTRSDFHCLNYFHQKTYKIKRCLEEGNDLVFVNGFEAYKQPNFVWLKATTLKDFVIRSQTKYGEVTHPGNHRIKDTRKPAYRFDTYWFKDLWRPLPVLIKEIPEEYREVLNLAKV